MRREPSSFSPSRSATRNARRGSVALGRDRAGIESEEDHAKVRSDFETLTGREERRRVTRPSMNKQIAGEIGVSEIP